MPKSSNDEVKEINNGLKLFSEHLLKSEKASTEIAKNFDELHRQFNSGHSTLLDYLKNVIKIPAPLQEMSKAIIASKEELKSSISYWKDLHRDHVTMNTSNEGSVRKILKLEESKLDLKERLDAVTGKNLATEYLLIRASYEAVKRSGEMNESLMQANSAYAVRQGLADNINEIQASTGASLQTMLESSKALINVWPKGRSDFKNVLETVVQMSDGLGVSFENSAKLAQIFQISLKVPVREVADTIAVIANNTSLAADEATRFAVEVGKALRLLGPGAATQVKEVTRYVTMLAGRMQDVGGDAASVVKLFNEMTKGTAEGFMLRGLAGVTNPKSLGTEAGTQAAMQGIDRMIKKIVTAGPGSPMYLAQLEQASQIMHMSTEDIVLWSSMIKEASKPLDEHARLQKRWQEQTEQANKAFMRIRESLAALVQKALSPMIPLVTSFLGAVANTIGFMASHRVAAYAGLAVFGIAVTKTIWSLYRLAQTLWQVTAASRAATRAKLMESGAGQPQSLLGRASASMPWINKIVSQIKEGMSSAKLARSLQAGLQGTTVFQKLGSVLFGMTQFTGKTGPLGITAGIAGAAIGGYAVGRVIDRTMDKIGSKWSAIFFGPLWELKKAAEYLGKQYYHLNIVAVTQWRNKTLTAWQVMTEVRKNLSAGKTQEAQDYFMSHAHNVKGLLNEKGAKSYLELFEQTATEVRERAGLFTTIVPLDEQRRFNQQQLDQQQQMVKNTGGATRILKEVKDQDKNIEDMRNSRTHAEFMRRAAEFRMLQLNGNPGAQKAVLTQPGAP